MMTVRILRQLAQRCTLHNPHPAPENFISGPCSRLKSRRKLLNKGPSIKNVRRDGGEGVRLNANTCGQGGGQRTLRTSAIWQFFQLFHHALQTLPMDDAY